MEQFEDRLLLSGLPPFAGFPDENWSSGIFADDNANLANSPITLVNPGRQTNAEGNTISLPIQARDSRGDALFYTATGLPTGFTIDLSSGAITGTADTGGDFQVR